MTPFRIKELERLGFEWVVCVTAWEDRLWELADYCRIHGHCNVPTGYSENTKLAYWVGKQRSNYRLCLEGKSSPMTPIRIKELESLGFEWRVKVTSLRQRNHEFGGHDTMWEERLSELADFRKGHGHCNVPKNSSENPELGSWVGTQRKQYRLHAEGKTSHLTTIRIQELESLGFDWKPSTSRVKVTLKKPTLDDYARRARERAEKPAEHLQQRNLKTLSAAEKSAASRPTSHSNSKNPTGMAKSKSTSTSQVVTKRYPCCKVVSGSTATTCF